MSTDPTPTSRAAEVLAGSLNVVGPLRHIFGHTECVDALEVLLAQEVEVAAQTLADAGLLREQEPAQGGLTEAEREALHNGVCPRHRDTAPGVYVCRPCEAAGDAVVERIKADAYAAGLAARGGTAAPAHTVHVTAEPVAEDVVWCESCEEWVPSGAPEGGGTAAAGDEGLLASVMRRLLRDGEAVLHLLDEDSLTREETDAMLRALDATPAPTEDACGQQASGGRCVMPAGHDGPHGRVGLR